MEIQPRKKVKTEEKEQKKTIQDFFGKKKLEDETSMENKTVGETEDNIDPQTDEDTQTDVDPQASGDVQTNLIAVLLKT